MSEREKDFTRDAPAGSHPQRARRSGRSYYYDDATGYEIYNPEEDVETVEDENAPTSRNDADTQPKVDSPPDEAQRK
ncbi:MAG: hypothetical protein H0V88_09870 [Pyrinomonadaceae bacterium]|jgi:hypothetical protein|nr:hypothetical protein [Pyrinomonadaceae bacterium]